MCVTNRQLCSIDFLTRVAEIAAAKPAGIILREKDLPEREYKTLAEKVLHICREHQVPCMLHTFVRAAMELGAPAIHLPLPILRTLSAEEKAHFSVLGASCHSVEEAMEAERLGCTYLTAGHIFATDCKKGLPPRGLDFLEKVCKNVSIPVYAIGGIDSHNIRQVHKCGAAGACVMSGLMSCENPKRYLAAYMGLQGSTRRVEKIFYKEKKEGEGFEI